MKINDILKFCDTYNIYLLFSDNDNYETCELLKPVSDDLNIVVENLDVELDLVFIKVSNLNRLNCICCKAAI